MADRPLHKCPHPSCRELTREDRCEKHKTPERSERSDLYFKKRWQDLRKIVRQRQPLCVECLKAGVRTATQEIDHIVPHRGQKDLFFRLSNLQGLCKSCHSIKTNRGR